jgi:hypothetical protein
MSEDSTKNLSAKAQSKLKSFFKDIAVPSKKSSNAIVLPLVAVFIVALVGVVVLAISMSKKEEKSKSKKLNKPASVVESLEEIRAVQQTNAGTSKKVTFKDNNSARDREDPNASFPSLTTTSDNDPEAEFARAFTYENLQDSMLSSAENARGAIKSREAWSRLGQRGDSSAWKSQMDAIKSEITASGKTFKDFVARIFQHEYDHLDGIVFLDRADSKDLITEKEYQKILRKK